MTYLEPSRETREADSVKMLRRALKKVHWYVLDQENRLWRYARENERGQIEQVATDGKTKSA